MIRRTKLIVVLIIINYAASAQIHSASFVKCYFLDLSAAGTIDWVVFRDNVEGKPIFAQASDFKKTGKGIDKLLTISGGVSLMNNRKVEHLTWNDGFYKTIGGDIDTLNNNVYGLTANFSSGSSLSVNFNAPGKKNRRMASVLISASNSGIAIVSQGKESKEVNFSKTTGVIQVEYEGDQPLSVKIVPAENQPLRIKNLAAMLSEKALWWMRDDRLAMLYQPIDIDQVLKESYTDPAPDYEKMAIDFADCMIAYGRDRYGEIRSPLFSNILTREKRPQTTPYPLFAKLENQEDNILDSIWNNEVLKVKENPYLKFKYNLVLNYPQGLGEEGPHKTTLYGCDIFEDRSIYDMLADLSRITDNSVYKAASEKAIDFWFRNTQSSKTGLYPWGEHMGWDLVNDCPVYFEGASQYFFEANYHEVRDFVPFVENLIALPAAVADEKTPLEKYAIGIWNAHFWDKEKAYYNRHGDYNGQVDQAHELGAYPAHLAFYLRIWAAAYLHSEKQEVKQQIEDYLRKTMDMAISRTKKYGFYPFDLEVDLKGKNPGKEIPVQSLRLAHHCVWMATLLEGCLPDIALTMREFSTFHLGDQPEEETLKNVEWALRLHDNRFLQRQKSTADLPDPNHLKDLSHEVQSEEFANEIIQSIWYAEHTGNEAYLTLADKYARIAKAVFCDSKSPLPTAFAYGVRSKTLYGKEFPDFYFKGAKLMWAFALLAERLKKQPVG